MTPSKISNRHMPDYNFLKLTWNIGLSFKGSHIEGNCTRLFPCITLLNRRLLSPRTPLVPSLIWSSLVSPVCVYLVHIAHPGLNRHRPQLGNLCIGPVGWTGRGWPGALNGGSPVSHVDFKKWQCCMSLSLIFHNVICQI